MNGATQYGSIRIGSIVIVGAILLAGALRGQRAFGQSPPPPPLEPGDTGFDVNRHGFSFANDRDLDAPCYTLVGLGRLRYDPKGPFCGNRGAGLCGGMSLDAGERFRAGLTSIELTKDAAKGDILNAQMQTLDEQTVRKFVQWIGSPDEGHTLDPDHSVGYLMKEDWTGAIAPRLDQREAVVVGLVFSKHLVGPVDGLFGAVLPAVGMAPTDPVAAAGSTAAAGALVRELSDQHQVLAIGYRRSGDDVELRAYDPNHPRDTLLLDFKLGDTGVRQRMQSGDATRHPPIRGIMFIRGVAAAGATAPVCPVGRFPTTGPLHGCVCEKGTKKYGGIADSEAWCEGAEACPAGKFSTVDRNRGCFCAKGTKKYGGIGNSEAWCEGATVCPGGKFSTTGEWRGCECPAGKKKKYHGLFHQDAECQ